MTRKNLEPMFSSSHTKYSTVELRKEPSFMIKPADIDAETTRILLNFLEKALHSNPIPFRTGIASVEPYGNRDISAPNEYIRNIVME
ncbi:MAG: hypothetical protein QW292_07455 [Candidatus Parvarchaeota archaeon]